LSRFKSAVHTFSFSCSCLESIVDNALLAIALAFSTSVAYKLKKKLLTNKNQNKFAKE